HFSDANHEAIYVTDWGLTEPLNLLHLGRLDLRDALHPSPKAGAMIADPHGVFVGHVSERDLFKDTRGSLEAAAAAGGYTKQIEQVIADSNGRPIFEIFRFSPKDRPLTP